MSLKVRYLFQITGILGWLAIIILSVVPANARPHSGAGGFYEHFVAYTLVAAALSAGFLGSHRRMLLLGLAASSGVFELVQIAIPGRTAELQGFVSGVLGVCCGALLVMLAEKWWARSK
jgi:hypothetical protein